MIRLRNTTPEIVNGWDYTKAHITTNPLANLWVAANTVLGSNWIWNDFSKIHPQIKKKAQVPSNDSGNKDESETKDGDTKMKAVYIPKQKKSIKKALNLPFNLPSKK